MQTLSLTEAARALLKRNMAGTQILVNDENREAYRELARAGLMEPLHTPLGRESAYRMTQEGMDFGTDLVGWDAQIHHHLLSMIVERLRISLGEVQGVKLRMPGNLPRRGRRADHGGMVLEAMEGSLDAREYISEIHPGKIADMRIGGKKCLHRSRPRRNHSLPGGSGDSGFGDRLGGRVTACPIRPSGTRLARA
jgi:hypothetical protein